MDFLTSNIGTAKDNVKSPIHNWYKFTAGFSFRFVDEIIDFEQLTPDHSKIFDPFAGCGTTLVSAQKNKIPAVGNEGQQFMYDVIRAKLFWDLDENDFNSFLGFIENFVAEHKDSFDVNLVANPLLLSLYEKRSLIKLYLIRNAIEEIGNSDYQLFFKLALSQTLHKVSIHPVAIPYISRSKTLSNTTKAWEFFDGISKKMFEDTKSYHRHPRTSKIHLHDSRKKNDSIEHRSCSVCITSPPYLNNLDYGEVSKVHTHFFNITSNWGDITKKVRKNLVTGATTHYSEAEFDLDNFRQSDFYLNNKRLANKIIKTSLEIRKISKERAGKKSFDILTLLYFKDMFAVLNEIYRVISKKGKAYLILGDSAPYGTYIPTTEYLGMIGKRIGFKDYEIHKIRSRGMKWKTLTHRHSLELSENVLILR